MELTFDALSKNYGKKQALIGFSAELTGGIYGLLGPNGAGKSILYAIMKPFKDMTDNSLELESFHSFR